MNVLFDLSLICFRFYYFKLECDIFHLQLAFGFENSHKCSLKRYTVLNLISTFVSTFEIEVYVIVLISETGCLNLPNLSPVPLLVTLSLSPLCVYFACSSDMTDLYMFYSQFFFFK